MSMAPYMTRDRMDRNPIIGYIGPASIRFKDTFHLAVPALGNTPHDGQLAYGSRRSPKAEVNRRSDRTPPSSVSDVGDTRHAGKHRFIEGILFGEAKQGQAGMRCHPNFCLWWWRRDAEHKHSVIIVIQICFKRFSEFQGPGRVSPLMTQQ